MRHLDSDLLRTFLATAKAGSVTGGAARIDRSQSATSLQIKQLEDVVGTPVFHRHGRGISLTTSGEKLLTVARRVVSDLDAALDEIRNEGLAGVLRIGLADDHGRATLSGIVAAFAAAHPLVELEVHTALGTGFARALEKGNLDLAVHALPRLPQDAVLLQEEHLVWMAAADSDVARSDPLPVAVFDRDCWWRDAALADLDLLERRYRVMFTSESRIGVWAAVHSGVAVGLLSKTSDGEGLVPVPELGSGHPTYLVLQTAPGSESPACKAMCNALRAAFP